MKWNLFCSCVTALLLAYAPAYAKNFEKVQNSKQHFTLNSSGSWFLSFGSGVQFPHLHSYMTVDNNSGFPAPYNQDLYSIKTPDAAVLAASAGYRWNTNNFWLPSYSLGLFWQYFFRTRIHGTVTEYYLPEFLNYTYNWDFTSNILLATAKINLFKYGRFSPFINGGIGGAFNKTTNYQEVALADVTQRVSPEFKTRKRSNFAYNWGAGIDLQYLPQLIFSVAYVNQGLGQISSGYGTDTWFSQTLNPGSYHANEVLVSATYLFDTDKNLTK